MKVAIYSRVGIQTNIKQELRLLRRIASDNGWEIVDKFMDYSAADNPMERQIWLEMLGKADGTHFQLLLTFSIFEISDSIVMICKAITMLHSKKIGIRALGHNLAKEDLK